MTTIAEKVRAVLANEVWGAADISCNLPLIAALLKEHAPAHVTEMGVRNAVSSWTFAQYAAERAAAGRAIEYVATDITRREPVGALDAAMAGCPGVAYAFREGDDLTIPQWDTDFLFLDTWHTYRQLAKELLRWAPRTRGVLVLHDTALFGGRDEGEEGHGEKPVDEALFSGVAPGSVGLLAAVNQFLASPAGARWRVAQQNDNCNGIMVLLATAPP